MTCTLVAIVVFFLVGELPNHIISKKAAFVFLSDGDINMVDTDELDVIRGVAMILGAINCSINFLLYIFLHPPFSRELKKMFSRKNDTTVSLSNLQINVFIVSHGIDIKRVTDVLPMFSDLITATPR